MTERSAPRVLLLEDQGLVRAGMRALIESCEPAAQVTETAGLEEAVASLAAATFDIAFIDIALKSGRSGLDLLRHIRDRNLPTRGVILSAHAEPELVMESLRLGACGYIPKDMEGEGLFRRALDTVLQGRLFLPAPLPAPEAAPLPGPPPASLEAMGVRGRALEALYYLCQGYSNKLIAHRMGISEATLAKDHNTRLFRLFRVTNRASLIVEVARRGFVIPPPVSAGAAPSGGSPPPGPRERAAS